MICFYSLCAESKGGVCSSRSRMFLPDDIANEERFYCYQHPWEFLLNRDLQSAVFLIDWHELSQNSLPLMHSGQLQLIGSYSGNRLEQWNNLLIRLGFHESSQSCCELPHDRCISLGNPVWANRSRIPQSSLVSMLSVSPALRSLWYNSSPQY